MIKLGNKQLIIKNPTNSAFVGQSLEDVLNGLKSVDEAISSFSDFFCKVASPEEVSIRGAGRVNQMISFPDGEAICYVSEHPDYVFLVHRKEWNFFYKYFFNCELKESSPNSN